MTHPRTMLALGAAALAFSGCAGDIAEMTDKAVKTVSATGYNLTCNTITGRTSQGTTTFTKTATIYQADTEYAKDAYEDQFRVGGTRCSSVASCQIHAERKAEAFVQTELRKQERECADAARGDRDRGHDHHHH